MKPMLPVLSFESPERPGWLYEIKYDGFRAFLHWDGSTIELISRNGKTLLPQFPEIELFLQANKKNFQRFFPLTLDCELVILENEYKADFSAIQTRGRMKSEKRIKETAEHTPARLMAFDVLVLAGKKLFHLPYLERKKQLETLFTQSGLPKETDRNSRDLLHLVKPHTDFHRIWEQVVLHDGEGIIAKDPKGQWEEGKRTDKWIKYKNWKIVNCFLTRYEKSNGYYYCGVYKDNEVIHVGHILFGLKPEEKQALFTVIKQNATSEDNRFIYVEPAICFEVKYLELYQNELREPHFSRFRFDLKPEDCTYDDFLFNQKNVPQEIELTHPEKPIWETPPIRKIDLVTYLREVSTAMLPFLQNRTLTVIRYPHGMFGEAFYQKNCPDYAPDFIKTYMEEGINYIVCNDLKTLVWLGNQLAIEFHIPFRTIVSETASEIVFDLDPPSPKEFGMAVTAALYIKEVIDGLNLTGFAKTSGNKGIQVYIPLKPDTYTFDDTRLFTEFIANYLVSKAPDLFTIERLKKNRGNRLYVDYVQHAPGKTIIAPYSPRGNNHAGVAAPLFWEEVEPGLDPKEFTLPSVLKRYRDTGDPFKNYFKVGESQPFGPVLEFLQSEK
ncbi:DNA ligase D [Neobacillus notoginsengisoli]|uniref:DNA ligase (ATP) n=1 Tax=Neobacillus notoginsengisoli TaxID=1578198 RepID=A0A417YXF0_9BACI|nr:DNA ligase D [Neobacillus notoginsengisoli]RHW42241.1 DNA ligase D [Neobacillus notoginsengisoli]